MKRGDPGYWKWKGNTGKPKSLKNPKILMDAAKEYFEWCDDNPLLRKDFIRSGEMAGTIIDIPAMRPYTWMGLEMWLRDKNIIAKLDDYRANSRDAYSEYSDSLTHIEKIIIDQKFSGAAAGFFNANIIARDLGLTEKSESTVTIEQPLFPDSD